MLVADIYAVNVQRGQVINIKEIEYVAAAMTIAALILCSVEDIFKKQIQLWKIGIFIFANLVLALCEKVGWKIILSGMLFGFIFMAVSICTKERIGKGDSFLIMGSGIYLGFGGTLVVVFAALLLASIYGVILMWKKKGWSYEIAFVPFLLVPYASAVILQLCNKALT